MKMSDFIKTIEEEIADVKDFSKVLRDVGIAFKNQGFFDDGNWKDKLIDHFSAVSVGGDHDISNSFVENSLKSTTNIMFEDSNDSFEIPETQAFPPVDHINDDLDDDSEGYVAMPDEGMQTNNCSQSQALLEGDELQYQSQNRPDFDDSDDEIDLEMSNLKWDDSAKDNDNNKSASVTPDLDFEALSTTGARVVEETLDLPKQSKGSSLSTSLDRNETNNKSSSISEKRDDKSSTSGKSSNVEGPEDNDQNIENIDPTKKSLDKENYEEEHVDQLLNPEIPSKTSVECDAEMDETQLFTEPLEFAGDKDQEIEKVNRPDQIDQLFQKPGMSAKELTKRYVHCDVDMAETQLFTKPQDKDEENEKENFDPTEKSHDRENDKEDLAPAATDQLFKIPEMSVKEATKRSIHCDVGMAETQLFTKAVEPVEEDEEIENFDPTEKSHNKEGLAADDQQLFKKPELFVTEGTKTSDSVHRNVEMAETQIFNKSEPTTSGTRKITRRKGNCISSSADEREDDRKSKDNNADNVVIGKFKLKKKLNRLIDSSDDEESVDDNLVNKSSAEVSNDDVYDIATQAFEVRRPESPVRKRLIDFKEHRWSKWCDEVNNAQSTIAYKSTFDQCKEFTKEVAVADVVPATSTINENVVAVAPKRQSSRSKTKAKPTEDSDVETKAPKRKRVPPVKSKVSADSTSTSSKSDTNDGVKIEMQATQPFFKASSTLKSKVRSDSTSTSSKSDTNDSLKIEMQATQPFFKASSTPKEETKAVKNSTRRQARSVTKEPSLPKEIKLPMHKLRATKNQSVTYSPKPADVRVSSGDENENVFTKASNLVKSEGVVSSRSRKRKATTEIDDDGSVAESSKSRSPSSNRSHRNQTFRVMFTMIDPELYESTLKELNMTITTSDNYNALVTNQIYRTVKFMCAVASGKPIVSVDWLNALKTKRARADPFEYLLKDSNGEKKYRFSLSKTLGEVVKNGGLFQNYSILVTPSTKPQPEILKEIISSSGGKFLKTSLAPRKGDRILCISAREDGRVVKNLKLKYPDLKEINVEQFMESIFKYETKF